METLTLGGNIVLSGFSQLDFTEVIVVKKMVGQFSKKLSETVSGFSRLSITLKEVHKTAEGHPHHDIVTKAVVDNKEYATEKNGFNLFVVLDESMKAVEEQIQKVHEKQNHHSFRH